MPKVPYKAEKTREDDEDYEIVSFEDFCDKSPSSKTDLLTLNDNINYRLCFETDDGSKFVAEGEGSSRDMEELKETSLGGAKTWKRKVSSSFAPFGRYTPNASKGSLFSGVIPKPKSEGESATREHRYQRFSSPASLYVRITSMMRSCGSTIALLCLIGVLSAGVWWAVCGAVGPGGDRHYRKLWERAHHLDSTQPPFTDKPIAEYHYHDHNNLSTKNKFNGTDSSRKKTELNKKSSTFTERPLLTLAGLCSKVTREQRFDCFPQDGASEEGCVKRGCCWNATTNQYGKSIGKPYCYYPAEYDTFHFLNMTENRHGLVVYYEKMRPSGYPDDFETVRMQLKYLSNDVLQIKITDADNKRFEPPYPEIPMANGPIGNLKYRVNVESSVVGFKVIRNEDNVTILDTQNVGGLILSDKFLQISTLLPTGKVYGLGERRGGLRVDMNWHVYTMFNHDAVPKENVNGYGTHPFYLALEDNGKSHGLAMLNSNAMDIVTQPLPAITYRTTGGVINLVLTLGPTPGEVVSQYTGVIGRPFMPPYWALGFHLCKYNYGSLNVTQDVWQKNRDAGIPFDVQWNDLDYMNNSNDFTYDTDKFAGLPQFVDKVHNAGMHYMVLIDPGVSASEKPGEYPPFDRGLELDIFIKNSSSKPFVGKVWNKKTTVWPDFTHPSATSYWVEMMTALHKKVPFDGAWIDMNEPSNFLSGSMYGSCEPEDLPYKPHIDGDQGLKTKTLCMDARHYGGVHADWHNLYSMTEAVATNFALTEIRGKRPFIISRSSYVGMGHYAGHWSGDISSDWYDMKMTIPEMLSFSLFGIPMMGADICGFNGNTTVELCKRWMQLGAFYPFARNHNSDSSLPQDPVSLGEEVVESSREALRMRYTLLPYYYTLFWRAHVYGETVVRPLFFEFPTDQGVWNMDDQFMVGPHLLVAPILTPSVDWRAAYLPGNSLWVALGPEIMKSGKVHLNDNASVLMRGGSIIPMQGPPAAGPVSTHGTRSMPLQLVAIEDEAGRARGELYWDSGDTLNSYEEKKYSHIEFSMYKTTINSTVNWWGFGVPSVNNITVYGLDFPIKAVSLNNKNCKPGYCEWSYDPRLYILRVFNMNLSLDKPFSLNWTYKHNFVKPMVPMSHGMLRLINDTVVVCKNQECSEYEKR